jgi:hypothetical protein
MRLALFVLASAPLWAQSLHITPSVTSRGTAWSFLVKLSSPEGKEPVSLQWELATPADVKVDAANIVAGSTAETAQKSITCAMVKNRGGEAQRFACILAGGKKIIADGTIAVVRYLIPEWAQSGTVTVRVEHALGVTAELAKIELSSADGKITIR